MEFISNTWKNIVLCVILKSILDIVDLATLKEDDDAMDRMLLDLGLAVNDSSAYKTIQKETVWMNE